MSYVPCAQCRHTDRGKLYYSYLVVMEGDDRQRWRLRLCAECRVELLLPLTEVGEREDGAGRWVTQEELAESWKRSSANSDAPRVTEFSQRAGRGRGSSSQTAKPQTSFVGDASGRSPEQPRQNWAG